MVGSDPLSGMTVTIVNRLDSISRCAAVIAGIEAFGEAAPKAACNKMEDILKRNMPEYQGELKDSVTTQQMGPKKWGVGPTAYYAPYVNYGTGPHVANVERITEWANDKGFDPSAMMTHIAKEGTQGVFYMEAAIAEAQGEGAGLVDGVVFTFSFSG
jgi:hypothetical protein